MKDFFAEFLKKTSYPFLSPSPQSQGAPQPPLEMPLPDNLTLIPLPAPETFSIPPADLRAIIEQRRTLRRYADAPLSLEELSYLLWLTQGVKRVTSRPATLRTVPSAGARHAFETFLLINRIQGLQPGLYRFAASQHALAHLPAPVDIAERIYTATHNQEHVRLSAVTFLWVADTWRMAWRYVERSMRYLFLDAGHVCQNLYLAAESIDCGVCAVGAFEDEAMNAALELDGVDRFVIYLATVGRKEAAQSSA
uniref:SagB/ThcOx family dehydrogenase n=1 Tax=Anaerolinea thermolimosa TaxID=229919 RepID=A0A7C4PHB1_9CHLR